MLGRDINPDVAIVCPRCGQQRTERFFGPCEDCRSELRSTLSGEQSELAEVEYVPKMNVTPNAVALKDD